MTRTLARLSGIERRFGSVVALDGAELELRAGEVHGLLGANGAGKSTLLAILGGMLRPDAGVVEIGGRPVTLTSPRDAWRHGIALVHQHFTLVPALSVLENLALGLRTRSLRDVRDSAHAVMERTGLRVPLDLDVGRLGVGDRQRIEILKALLRDPLLLVLDEPTAVLAPSEIEGLFRLLRDVAEEGCGVLLVAHKLDEVLGVADRVTVLRRGRTVFTVRPSERTPVDFVRAMVGGAEPDVVATAAMGVAEPDVAAVVRPDAPLVARLRDVSVRSERGHVVRDVNLEVRAGEVVGIAGVEGNGQHELALVLAGRRTPTGGEATIPDEPGFIPQDRSTEGLISDFDLTENVALALQRAPRFTDGPWMRWPELRVEAEAICRQYEVTAPSVATRGRALSGGNQQRLIVGREVALGTPLLVAENPSRGLDVTAAAFVHSELRRLAAEGVGIVLLSTDLDEVLALATVVCVMTGGKLIPVPDDALSREGVGALMLHGAEVNRV